MEVADGFVVLTLGFKVIDVNLIFFSSLISAIAVYLTRFSNCIQKFQEEKQVWINHWNLMNEQNQPLKVFCKNR